MGCIKVSYLSVSHFKQVSILSTTDGTFLGFIPKRATFKKQYVLFCSIWICSIKAVAPAASAVGVGPLTLLLSLLLAAQPQ